MILYKIKEKKDGYFYIYKRTWLFFWVIVYSIDIYGDPWGVPLVFTEEIDAHEFILTDLVKENIKVIKYKK